jgi:hypothetical protein
MPSVAPTVTAATPHGEFATAHTHNTTHAPLHTRHAQCTEDVGHGVELTAKERAVGAGQGLDQPGVSLHARVLVEVVLDRRLRRSQHKVGRRKVWRRRTLALWHHHHTTHIAHTHTHHRQRRHHRQAVPGKPWPSCTAWYFWASGVNCRKEVSSSDLRERWWTGGQVAVPRSRPSRQRSRCAWPGRTFRWAARSPRRSSGTGGRATPNVTSAGRAPPVCHPLERPAWMRWRERKTVI